MLQLLRLILSGKKETFIYLFLIWSQHEIKIDYLHS